MVMFLRHGDTQVSARRGDLELFRYVYRPADPQLESPRPYFHPVRTLRGDEVTIYRPHDHVWHKGIALSLPHVGRENFWGGPTFRAGRYVQLPNDGAMRHDGFDPIADNGADDKNGVARLDERLRWVTESGQTPVTERRRIAVAAWPKGGAWVLAFETTMTNASGADIVFGSPTTEGRPSAGYGGLFWRGPRSFTGGTVIVPGGRGGDELMGDRASWLGFAGRHDGRGGASTVVFRDAPENFSYPSQWFVRSTPFAAVCPAPFFGTTRTLAAGDSLTLRYDIVVADGELGPAECAMLTSRAAASNLIASAGND
jgi:methane monooxygenase PmoA-like